MKYSKVIIIFIIFVFAFPAYADNTEYLDLESSSSQAANITDAAQTGLDITSDFTFEVWANWESLGVNTILSKWQDTNGYRSYSWLYTGGNMYLNISPDGTDANKTTATFSWTPSVDTWYHLALTYDASEGESKFYVNGSQQDATETGLATSIYNGQEKFQVGCVQSACANHFDGYLDDLRIWTFVKTEEEIDADNDCHWDGDKTDLVSNWLFDFNLNDNTTTGNNLTNWNSATFGSSTPDLPFTDECVEATSSPATSTPIDLSVELGEMFSNDISIIGGETFLYEISSTTGSSTLIQRSVSVFHIPFLIYITILIPFLWIAQRLIIEVIIRLRR